VMGGEDVGRGWDIDCFGVGFCEFGLIFVALWLFIV